LISGTQENSELRNWFARSLAAFFIAALFGCASNSSFLEPIGNQAQNASNGTVALVFVIEGHKMWMGNESYETEQQDVYEGVFSVVAKGLEGFATIGSPGSTATVITYSTGSVVTTPTKPLEMLRAKDLGKQRDYEMNVISDLDAGVTDGLKVLDSNQNRRLSKRILIVIGDGTDVNPETSKVSLARSRKRAADAGIRILFIKHESEFKEAREVTSYLLENNDTIAGSDLAEKMRNAAARVQSLLLR
jgi:hypothetical protein